MITKNTNSQKHNQALDLPKRPTQDLLDRCAKAAISCSYHIFLARNSPSWSPPPLLTFLTLFHSHIVIYI